MDRTASPAPARPARSYRDLSPRACLLGLLIAIVVAGAGQVTLQLTFATVRHPTSLMAANLTADPDEVRRYYGVLDEQGTFGNMVRTELADYFWMFGLALFVFFITMYVGTLLRRRNPVASRRLIAWAPFTPVVAVLDAVENAFSLGMLSAPASFPDWLAYAHAGFSWLKVAAIVVVGIMTPAYAIVAAIRGAPREFAGRR